MADRRPAPPRPPGTFRIGTIAGSDVLVSSSWFLVAVMIAVVMGPRIEQVQPGLGPLRFVAGLVFAVVLYGSVLLHEASHAVAARRYGLGVTSITLHFLGGMTAIEGEARRPREEFWIAVVGPITSIAVGLAALASLLVLPGGLIGLVVEGLAGANLLVGVLNLVPGLPLDGGRVLKSAVWRISGDVHAGTIAAAWGGRATAVAALVWPTLQGPLLGTQPDVLDYVLSFVIAAFLWSGASMALTNARVRRRLPALHARALARRPLVVAEETPLAEAVRRAREARAGGIVTVDAHGTAVGVVNEAALLATPEERRPWLATSVVARRLEPGLRLPADLAGEELVEAITATPSGEFVLLEPDGTVYGVLTTIDVDRAYRASLAR